MWGVVPKAVAPEEGKMKPTDYRKLERLMAAVALTVAVPGGAALAATLSNLSGQSCGDAIGTWHFVNNQTGGAADGTLIANFTSGQCTVGTSKNTGSTQHFYCVGYGGTLLGATTGSLPGKLVLSDFSCASAPPPPPPPPPPCDPKTDPTCKG